MSIPRFCKDCKNILNYPNIVTGKTTCGSCHKVSELDDLIIAVDFFDDKNGAIKEIYNDDISRLIGEPTTKKVVKDCPNCKSKYMNQIHDENYNFIFGCQECGIILK